VEKPLFENIKATRMEPPPWVWDRISVSVSNPRKEGFWLHRLLTAAVVASLFLSMGTFEVRRMIETNMTDQSIVKIFAPNSSDLLVSWDI
jgi:hypothetical protein